MSTSDIVGLVIFASFGAWWAVAPRSVIGFYTWFHGARFRARNPLLIRVIGSLWILLVVGVFLFGRK